MQSQELETNRVRARQHDRDAASRWPLGRQEHVLVSGGEDEFQALVPVAVRRLGSLWLGTDDLARTHHREAQSVLAVEEGVRLGGQSERRAVAPRFADGSRVV